MYHKVRNTLASLGLVLAVFTGGILLSEPLPTQAARAPELSTEAQQVQAAFALVQAALALAQAAHAAEASTEQVAEPRHAPQRDPSRLKLELGMPYYSFGTLLPRRRES